MMVVSMKIELGFLVLDDHYFRLKTCIFIFLCKFLVGGGGTLYFVVIIKRDNS